MDVVIDGLTTIQQRRDPNSGSEDLQTFQFIGSSMGMMCSASIGSAFTHFGCPRRSFIVWAVVGMFVTLSAFKMSQNLESIHDN